MDNILIVAAHPDDDIIGCGGFLSKYRNKYNFRVIFIAEGSSCRFSEEDINSKLVINAIKKRNSNGVNALFKLGVKSYKFYNLPCGRLDQVPLININKIIENEINNFKPKTIFTHSNKDANNDHLIIHKSTLIATRPGSKFFVNNIFSYEILSSSEWKFTDVFKPNMFEKLSLNDVNNKWDALKEYNTEIKKFPYPRSYEGIKILANYRGMQSNTEYSEAFEIIRKVDFQ